MSCFLHMEYNLMFPKCLLSNVVRMLSQKVAAYEDSKTAHKFYSFLLSFGRISQYLGHLFKTLHTVNSCLCGLNCQKYIFSDYICQFTLIVFSLRNNHDQKSMDLLSNLHVYIFKTVKLKGF